MLKKFQMRLNITSIWLIVLTVTFWMIFANFAFFRALLNDYQLNVKNLPFHASIVFCFASVNVIVLCLFCFSRTVKPILIVLLIASSLAAYFMDIYNTIIDDTMLRNVFETDTKEASDLLSWGMFFYLLLLGILPSVVVYRVSCPPINGPEDKLGFSV